ncbi:hypothetical protein IMG5_116800, partial [Ichthyophthirius multifiliis]
LFEISSCTLTHTQNNQKQSEKKGILAIYHLEKLNLYVLKLQEFQYSLSKQIPVMKKPHLNSYVFPQENSKFSLLTIPKETPLQQVQYFEQILQQNSDFLISEDIAETEKKQQNWDNLTPSKKIQGYLYKGGDFIKAGIITGAGYLAQGIQEGGQYIQAKVTKKEEVIIKPETVQKVKLANVTSSAVLNFTKAQVEGLLQGVKVIGNEIANQAANSETGKKIQSHKNYQDVKNVTKGAVNAVANVYEGMYQALCLIGRGIQGATTGVIGAKYGDDAAKIANDGLDVVGNVGDMGRITKNGAIKAVQDCTQSTFYHGGKQ